MHRGTLRAPGQKIARNLVTVAALEPVVCIPISVRWSMREAAHARIRPVRESELQLTEAATYFEFKREDL